MVFWHEERTLAVMCGAGYNKRMPRCMILVMPNCLHGKEAVIYGDKAYASEERRQAAVDRGVDWRVSRKASRGKRLNCADRSFNRKSNRTRSRVEHAFGVVKHLWGYRKVRYRGLEKNGAQVFTLFALANFYLAS